MRWRAVIFDMDGTLTRPLLDFAAIRADIGLAADDPILETMARMTPGARRRAEAVLRRHEDAAARESELNDGAAELLTRLAGQKVPLGLLTRNTRRSVRFICRKHGLAFDAVVTRHDAAPKPSPEGVLKLCAALAVAPAEACVVGDYAFDVDSGRAAGCGTVAVLHGRRPTWAERAEVRVDSLTELIALWNI
jgi:HAD superfamily hydrolase (TIGR01509 family)